MEVIVHLVVGAWNMAPDLKNENYTLPVLPILDAVILKALQKTNKQTNKQTNKTTKNTKNTKNQIKTKTKNSVLWADGPLK